MFVGSRASSVNIGCLVWFLLVYIFGAKNGQCCTCLRLHIGCADTLPTETRIEYDD